MDDYLLDANKKDKFNPFGSEWLMCSATKKVSSDNDNDEIIPDIGISSGTSKSKSKFRCLVKVEFAGNEFEAETKEEYIQKVIESFKEEFDLDIDSSEIHDVEEV